MAYSFKIDGKLGDKLDGSDVNDPDGELPVTASSTAVLVQQSGLCILLIL